MESFDAVAYINTSRWQTMSLGLSRTRLLMEKLGNPQKALKFVHVAGTNGKGSTCVYVANILQAAGYTTGMFTSPYIEKFEERIQVNGCPIECDALTSITLSVKGAAEEVERETEEHPTEFELMTAVALCYFARQACDIVVLEVGLGGRLDSTNIIDAPEVCAIARIGLDHTAFLGNTLAQVAGEKAGIIKAGARVVSYPQETAAQAVIEHAASEVGAAVIVPDFSRLSIGSVAFAANKQEQTTNKQEQVANNQEYNMLVRSFSYDGLNNLHTTLLGKYQPGNAAFAIEIVRALCARGWNITPDHIRAGVQAARWPGRFEVLVHTAGKPWIVIDGGHNPQGIVALRSTCEDVFPKRAPWVVLSLLADKDYNAMTETLVPFAQGFVAVTPPNVRALPAHELAAVLRQKCADCGRAHVPVVEAQSFDEAREKVMKLAAKNDVIVVSGSLYSVASAKKAFCL